LTRPEKRRKLREMKIVKTTLVLLALALTPALAESTAAIDKDGCVKGQPCRCTDCGQICGSDACKVSSACKGDACSKS
jgi:hypothetical protein